MFTAEFHCFRFSCRLERSHCITRFDGATQVALSPYIVAKKIRFQTADVSIAFVLITSEFAAETARISFDCLACTVRYQSFLPSIDVSGGFGSMKVLIHGPGCFPCSCFLVPNELVTGGFTI